jgi:hypothetical protein
MGIHWNSKRNNSMGETKMNGLEVSLIILLAVSMISLAAMLFFHNDKIKEDRYNDSINCKCGKCIKGKQ